MLCLAGRYGDQLLASSFLLDCTNINFSLFPSFFAVCLHEVLFLVKTAIDVIFIAVGHCFQASDACLTNDMQQDDLCLAYRLLTLDPLENHCIFAVLFGLLGILISSKQSPPLAHNNSAIKLIAGLVKLIYDYLQDIDADFATTEISLHFPIYEKCSPERSAKWTDVSEARAELRMVGSYISLALLDTLAIDSRSLSQIVANKNVTAVLGGLLRARDANAMVAEVARDVVERIAHGHVSSALLERFDCTIMWLASETERHATNASNATAGNSAATMCFGLSIVSGFAKAITQESQCCTHVILLTVHLLSAHTDAGTHIAQVLFLAYVLCERVPLLVRDNRSFVTSLIRRSAESTDISFGVSALITLHCVRPLADFRDELAHFCSISVPQVRDHVQAIMSDVELVTVADNMSSA